MSRIEKHIEILLLENDCVIVPGLGGFVAHHIPARYDEQEQLFLPPYRTLGFNPLLTVNDSLLAQSYMETYDVSFPEAIHQIEEEVASIQQTLADEGVFELNDLGKLVSTTENTMRFEPFEGGILSPTLYGLNSFEFSLKKQKAVKLSLQNTESETELPVVTSRPIVTEVAENGEKRISISIKTLRNVAVAAAVLVLAVVIALPLQKRNGLSQDPVKSGMFYNLFDSSEAPAAQSTPEPPTQKVAQKSSSTHYWALVLASHVTERNAQAFTQELIGEGFSQTRVYESNGSLKVLYGTFHNQDEAYNELRSLKDVKHFKDAWIIEIDK